MTAGTATTRLVYHGALIGFVFGTCMAIFLQLQPRLCASSVACFSGAPLGLDQWVYTALARAVLRSPTKLTYEYPFALFWGAPRVLVQLPIAAAAWLSTLLGYPLAFEILRIIGATGTGAALALIGQSLFRHRLWRKWFYLVAAMGGGWFTFFAVIQAVRTAGLCGLTEIDIYLQRSMGALYWWLPFLAQNIWSPLESIYHALVLGSMAFALTGRTKIAALLGLITWFSNPFPAAALYGPMLLWLTSEILCSQTSIQRRKAVVDLLLWGATALMGFGYYAWFLPQWPVFDELAAMHRTPLAPAPTFAQLVAWLAPFCPAAVWMITARSGHRHLWRRPAWRLVAFLFLTQLLFLAQFLVLRDQATQPYHFNRGYLMIACAALLIRWLQHFFPLRPTRLAAFFLSTLLFDQSLFFVRLATQGVQSGYVPAEIVQVRNILAAREPTQVFVSHAYPYSVYLAADTDHIPYDMPETMVVPWPEKRDELLKYALKEGPAKVAALGVSLAVVGKNDSQSVKMFEVGGWDVVGETQHYLIFELPKERRRPVPHLPPPSKES